MTTPEKLKDLFWDALERDHTVMLGLQGVDDGHTRPMGAHFLGGHAPIWFFTTRDNPLARGVRRSRRAICTFTASDLDLFASIHGELSAETDRRVLDRLWNRHTAAWYDEGKNDPSLALLRLDPDDAEIWQNASTFGAGIRVLFGLNPIESYRDKSAEVSLRS
ncbi:MAG: pyridoxamine 5'-phosphate oxidase family protein [Hyphomicrobiales bacterium]